MGPGLSRDLVLNTNAVWFRLAVPTHNVLTAFKGIPLPAQLRRARPKRLRFLIVHTPGRLVQHARPLVLRLATTTARVAAWLEVVSVLPVTT